MKQQKHRNCMMNTYQHKYIIKIYMELMLLIAEAKGQMKLSQQ